jgi:hypothetical protein
MALAGELEVARAVAMADDVVEAGARATEARACTVPELQLPVRSK